MKTKIFIPVLMALILLTVSSCEDRTFQTFTANVPVYLSYDELRKSIGVEEPAAITKPGKIFFKDNYIFINEFMEGVHVIDITDPSSPESIGFIPVPGNIDMAIKDSILYLDSYTDLVMIDISDPGAAKEVKRIEDVLAYTLPPYDSDYPLAIIDEDEGVVTGWEVKEHTQEIQKNPYPWPIFWEYSSDSFRSNMGSSVGGGAGGSAYGIGGSMARFLTYDNYLYMLQETYQLKVLDISDTESPELIYEKYVGWGLETMFIYEGYMYLGATNGLYILSLQDPKSPFTTSVYSHITSCDPVVVSGNLAYVTLRSGNMCGGTADLLEVINVSDKYHPQLIASYGMNEPYGLGIADNILFICQGDNGLVVYDATDPMTITSNKLSEFTDIRATDVIPVNNFLFTIGDSGFYIYDYSDINDIHQIGSIPVSDSD
ncbi:MAG: hypothetical protein WD052_12370 [Bacteroidales bacterium]